MWTSHSLRSRSVSGAQHWTQTRDDLLLFANGLLTFSALRLSLHPLLPRGTGGSSSGLVHAVSMAIDRCEYIGIHVVGHS